MESYKNLTNDERSRSYAKYFDRASATPPKEALAVMDKSIDPSMALMPENRNDLLNPGYLASEAGWCILPNGAGYVSNHTKMPGVTVEMINWWFAWHALEPLRYKIWWPQGHYDLQISEEARKKILDLSIPMEQKHYGVTHHVIEDIGGGAADSIRIEFKSPEDYGFDMTRFKAPNVGALVAGVGYVRSAKSLPFIPRIPVMMCHLIREIPGGVEYRTRFWMGYNLANRKPQKRLPPFVKLPAKVAKGLAIHNVYEYHNLASFLPQIYEEQKTKME